MVLLISNLCSAYTINFTSTTSGGYKPGDHDQIVDTLDGYDTGILGTITGGDLKADGTVPLTSNWDVGAYTITGTRFISDIAIGTAPFPCTSTTVNTNLNADLLDGIEASAIIQADGSVLMTDDLDLNSNKIINLTDGVDAQDAVTFAQLHTAVSGTNFDFFFNDTASDIGGIYYVMSRTPTGGGESELSTAGLGIGQDQALVNFATIANDPGWLTLGVGTYESHIHAERTAGNRTATLYFELYKRTSGGSETLLATSEESDEVTSKAIFEIHAVISSEVDLLTTDRVVQKWYANVTGGGVNNTIVIYAEGVVNSRLSLKTTSSALDGIYEKLLVDANGLDTAIGSETTGTGDLVRATSPTLVTPALGTPASGTLTNCTGYTETGDIESVLGDTSGAVPLLFQDASAFTGSDADPDVSGGIHHITADTTTYIDFDGTPVDGQQLWIYCAHAATFDLTSSGIEAWNRTTDLVATVGFVAVLIYEDDDSQWHFVNAPDAVAEISSNGYIVRTGAGTAAARTIEGTAGEITITNGNGVSGNTVISGEPLKFSSLVVAGLDDTTTPSVLTTIETTNKCISNYKSSGADHVFTMPAAHVAGNIIFTIADEFQVDIEPDSGDNFVLNGLAMANDEHIQNTADTLYKRIVGYCVNINGTLKWLFYSSDIEWVEATP